MKLLLSLALALSLVACSDDSKPPQVDAGVKVEASLEASQKVEMTVKEAAPQEAAAKEAALPTQ